MRVERTIGPWHECISNIGEIAVLLYSFLGLIFLVGHFCSRTAAWKSRMSEPVWLSYTGVVTGAIGTITGVAGAIMGYIGLRHSKQLKALDLRLQLRKADSDLRADVQELPALLELARKSHDRVAAATGMLESGASQQWTSAWEEDFAAVRALEGQLPDADASYTSATPDELESKLVVVHTIASRAARLRDKYLGRLAADDTERDHLREDLRVRTQSNFEGKQ